MYCNLSWSRKLRRVEIFRLMAIVLRYTVPITACATLAMQARDLTMIPTLDGNLEFRNSVNLNR